MKKVFLSVVLLFSVQSFARPAASANSVQEAIRLLAGASVSSETFRVSSGKDAKQMMLELALQEEIVEDEQDFESSWQENVNDAWEPDSTNWALETLEGARDYVEFALRSEYERSADPSEIETRAFKASLEKSKQAFEILKAARGISFGVGPMGAVQCGVRFGSLLILDKESGEVHNIIGESSGC